MKINERIRHGNSLSGLILPFSALVIYIILVWFLSRPLAGWFFLKKADEQGLISAVKFDGNNATYHYMLGRYYHLNLVSPDLDRAALHYSRSLMLSPLQAGAWIDISKVYQTKGNGKEAEYALERAVRLSPNNPDLMWEAGTFWLINNMTDKAVGALRQYILLMPDMQTKAYDLCWKLDLGNGYITGNLVPDSYEYRAGYLAYLINTGRVEESEEVWQTIDNNSLQKDLFILYVNFLINNSRYDSAGAVWDNITSKIEGKKRDDVSSPVWNPDFEDDILNGGFDWVVREAEGADVFLDDTIRMTGSRSVGVTFDGKHNPDVTIIQQVVRVSPGAKYTLRGYVKTASLTTTNGIFFSIQGHNCSGFNKRSDVITGTNFWREVILNFETPADCRAVTINARRERSGKFDNKIEGTAWIDGITLKQQADLPKTGFKKP
ncbi:MAG: carbohydrate binding domain-containing protein [Nitrospirota bacterium]